MASRLALSCGLSSCSTAFARHAKSCITESSVLFKNFNLGYSTSNTWRALPNSVDEISEQTDAHEDERPTRNVEGIKRIKPKQFELSFEEYIKLKGSLRTRQRVAGMPFAVIGLGTSSVVSAYMFPEMFDATPENVQLIM